MDTWSWDDDPRLVMLSLQSPTPTSLSLTNALNIRHNPPAVVFLTEFVDEADFLAALRSGVAGYLARSEVPPKDLPRLIEEVAQGGTVLSRSFSRQLFDIIRSENIKPQEQDLSLLSQREALVFNLLCQGYRPKEVAQQLDMSYQTVRTHQKNIYKKLGVNSLAQAILATDSNNRASN